MTVKTVREYDVDKFHELRDKFLSKCLFEYFYEEAKELFGEQAARQLLYKIMKDSSKAMANELKEVLKAETQDWCTFFKTLFNLFEINNVECKIEGSKMTIEVRECPIPDLYDKERSGKACIAMMAILAGVTEAVSNKKIQIITPKVRLGHPKPEIVVVMKRVKLLGDEECLFEAEFK